LETYINIAELAAEYMVLNRQLMYFLEREPIKLTMDNVLFGRVIPRLKNLELLGFSLYITKTSQIITQMGYLGGKEYLKQFM
jgi:hypothetical protein